MTKIQRTKGPALSRRRLLQGGLAALALSPVHRLVSAQAAPRRRFVFLLSGNGFDGSVLMSRATREWIPMNGGREVLDHVRWGDGYGAPRAYGASLRSPEVIDGDLTTASGLANLGPLAAKSAVVLGLSSRITGGGHETMHGLLSSTRTIAGAPSGRTLDHHLAQLPSVRGVGGSRTPIGAIRVGVHHDANASITYDSCASGPGLALPTINSAQAAWDAYVGPLASADGAERIARRTRYLELARRDAQRTAPSLPSASSRAQVATYQAAVEELLADQDRFGEVIESTRSSGLVLPARPDGELAPLEQLRAQCATVSVALRAGLTNVAVVGMGTGSGFHGFDYGFGALAGAQNHGLRHVFAAGNGEPTSAREDLRRDFRRVWREEIEALASIASDLEATPEPGGSGSMLDHTVLVYVGDNGAEHHASASEFPLLIMGGGEIGLRTGGRTIVYPDVFDGGAAHRQLTNLWLALGGPIAGERLDRFGAANLEDPMPLPELLG